MNDFNAPEKKILVCLKLSLSSDSDAENKADTGENAKLIKAAKNLSHRIGAQLRLLSVCEPNNIDEITGTPWQPMFHWQEKWLASAIYEQKREEMEVAKRQLDKLAAKFDLGDKTETHVVSAFHASQGILADAVANGASLILLNAGFKADAYFTRGYSTPLAVMANAMLPVLVVGQACPIDFSEPRLRIMVADDLREATARAMQKSTEWASNLGSCDVCHVHIEELSQADLKRLVIKGVSKLRTNADSQAIASELIDSIEESFKKLVAERSAGAEEQLKKSNSTFRFELRRGPHVREEIERLAEEFHAGLLVFGRHQKLHYQPLQIGRVAYQTMLSQKYAVMILP